MPLDMLTLLEILHSCLCEEQLTLHPAGEGLSLLSGKKRSEVQQLPLPPLSLKANASSTISLGWQPGGLDLFCVRAVWGKPFIPIKGVATQGSVESNAWDSQLLGPQKSAAQVQGLPLQRLI